ncbi:hypothetical protein O6H91_05G027500 [Diphasiastrum complanatum]|uniref:Uncharacterized protein n=1 Tax=Diphasiastrum complanatum TaxID=34168 RepID=A0ACC2DM30_DIPCM|nr:hypothetical protein O6H91_05G027500 [Diphasiastrum complanatum]
MFNLSSTASTPGVTASSAPSALFSSIPSALFGTEASIDTPSSGKGGAFSFSLPSGSTPSATFFSKLLFVVAIRAFNSSKMADDPQLPIHTSRLARHLYKREGFFTTGAQLNDFLDQQTYEIVASEVRVASIAQV